MTATITTTDFYIGRCREKGCKHALRTQYADVQDIPARSTTRESSTPQQDS
jgi:hypothetical protein